MRITSAPISANSIAQNGAGPNPAISITLSPSSGPAIVVLLPVNPPLLCWRLSHFTGIAAACGESPPNSVSPSKHALACLLYRLPYKQADTDGRRNDTATGAA